jgi:Flp pilus assembly protein TadD
VASPDAIEAIACHRRALELKPAYPQVHHQLGLALKDLGQFE